VEKNREKAWCDLSRDVYLSCILNDRAKRHARARRGAVAPNQCTGAGLCTLVFYLYMLVCRLYRSVISSTDEGMIDSDFYVKTKTGWKSAD